MSSSQYPTVITARISDIGGKKGIKLELSISRKESYLLPKEKHTEVYISVEGKRYKTTISHGSSPSAKWYFTTFWYLGAMKLKMFDVLLKTGLMNEDVQLKVLSSTEFELLT